MAPGGQPTSDESKVCTRCGLPQPLSAFGSNRSRKDGLAQYCRTCFREIGMESCRRPRAARGLSVRERRTAPPGTAWCPDCEAFRDVADFPRNRSTSSGYAAYCKPHQYERTRQSRDRVGGSRGYHLKRRYGLTAEDVEAMRAEQRGLCAVCRRVLGPGAHVDHDHRTGAVRGLLCFTCNVGLGNFKDDPGRLEQAARYLRRVPLPDLVFEVSPEAWRHPIGQVGSRA